MLVGISGEKTCTDETMNERRQWRDCQDEEKVGFHRDDEGQCDPLDHHEQLSSWNLCSGGGNLLLDEFLLLWIKAPFSTSSYSQVGDYLSAGPCIQDASCESLLYICFIRHKGACLSSWFLTESFTNIWSMCTLSFNTPFIDCKLQYIHSKF